MFRGDDVDDAVDLIVNNLSAEGAKDDRCSVHVQDVCNVENSPILSPIVLKEQAVFDVGQDKAIEHVISVQQQQASRGVTSFPRIVHTSSCPPCQDRVTSSGPWSIEWLNDHFDEEAGIVFSSKKKKPKSNKS